MPTDHLSPLGDSLSNLSDQTLEVVPAHLSLPGALCALFVDGTAPGGFGMGSCASSPGVDLSGWREPATRARSVAGKRTGTTSTRTSKRAVVNGSKPASRGRETRSLGAMVAVSVSTNGAQCALAMVFCSPRRKPRAMRKCAQTRVVAWVGLNGRIRDRASFRSCCRRLPASSPSASQTFS